MGEGGLTPRLVFEGAVRVESFWKWVMSESAGGSSRLSATARTLIYGGNAGPEHRFRPAWSLIAVVTATLLHLRPHADSCSCAALSGAQAEHGSCRK